MSLAHLRERHLVGGVLLGAYPPPDDFEPGASVADRDLAYVLDAVKFAHGVTEEWPVDLPDVLSALEKMGVADEVGGADFLLYLVEAWSDAETRSRELAQRLAAVQVIDAALVLHRHAEGRLADAIDLASRARAMTVDATALLAGRAA